MGKVDGKVAIITGAASGMGYRHAERFVEEGAKVIIGDINAEVGEKLAAELGENATFVKLDVTSAEDWENAVKIAEEKYGPVNVLVNNAGMGIFKWTAKMTEAEFRKVLDINTVSVFLSYKDVVPSMEKAGGGSIINISSVDGLYGAPRSMAYSASKFAVTGMTKVGALEFGTRYNIRVNSVHPGVIRTPLAADGEAAIEGFKDRILLGRMGTTDEASNMVLFLASDDSSYCTGTQFLIDGGLTSCI